VAPSITTLSLNHWYVSAGFGLPLAPTATAVSTSPNLVVPDIEAEVIDGEDSGKGLSELVTGVPRVVKVIFESEESFKKFVP
jgi:hypothetical protein